MDAVYRNRENKLPFSICQVWGQNGEEAKYNARLIASAPEMLAALLEVQEDYRDLLRASPTDDEARDIDEMLQIVDTAIAKATGN